MKSTLKYLFVLLTLPFIAGAQVPLAKVNNQAFGPSEVLEYRVTMDSWMPVQRDWK